MSRRHKYGAAATIVDGIRFDSKAEAKRYSELKLLERAGSISQLELQPSFDFIIKGMPCGSYRGDFRYQENGKDVVEDVKGYRTDVYRLKRKLFKALFPEIDFREVKA